MSKTKQRKDQAFYEGYHDARKSKGFRWKRHPYLGRYKAGYKKGKAERQDVGIVGYDDL